MDSNIIGHSIQTGITSNTDRFLPLVGSSSNFDTASGTQNVMPCSGTLSNLYVTTDTAPGASITRTVAVYKNGVQTPLAVSMNNTTSGNDTNASHTIYFTAGDGISIVTNATSPSTSSGVIRWSLKMRTPANVSAVMQNSQSNLSATATSYLGIQGSNVSVTANTDVAQVFPTSGTLKNAYILFNNSPGTGKSFSFTLFKGTTVAGAVATSITATVSDTNTLATDLAHSISVSPGDILYWQVTPSGSPPTRACSVSLEFDPTTNGESVQCYGSSASPSASAVRFQDLHGSVQTINATESNRTMLTQACTWKNLYVAYDASPGASKQYQHQFSINGVAGNPTVTISGTNTTGSDTSNTISTSVGDSVSMKITPTGTPATAVNMKWAMVNFITPPASLTNTKSNFMPFFR